MSDSTETQPDNDGQTDCTECGGHEYGNEWQTLKEGVRQMLKHPNKVTELLAGRPPDPTFGHDLADLYEVMGHLVAAAGLPADWQRCAKCKGADEMEKLVDNSNDGEAAEIFAALRALFGYHPEEPVDLVTFITEDVNELRRTAADHRARTLIEAARMAINFGKDDGTRSAATQKTREAIANALAQMLKEAAKASEVQLPKKLYESRLKPGPALDVLIEERVFGNCAHVLTLDRSASTATYISYKCRKCDQSGFDFQTDYEGKAVDVPPYSTNMAYAWNIVTELPIRCEKNAEDVWERFVEGLNIRCNYKISDLLLNLNPLGICVAALDAVGALWQPE